MSTDANKKDSLVVLKKVSLFYGLPSLARFPKSRQKSFPAVFDIDLEIRRKEIFGLVGESGCGKTSLAMATLLLKRPQKGSVLFDGTDLTSLRKTKLRSFRKRMQIVFQDTWASLNPRMHVGRQIAEPIMIHGIETSRTKIQERVKSLLASVSLSEETFLKYPHELSGGQRQRIGIARALAVEPDFLVADEPTSSLDVTVQAQIMELLVGKVKSLGLTCMFISHNLNLVRMFCDQTAVMYCGKIIEKAPSANLWESPLHPYTQTLKNVLDNRKTGIPIYQKAPGLFKEDKGCAYYALCEKNDKTDFCTQKTPDLREVQNNHMAACHFC